MEEALKVQNFMHLIWLKFPLQVPIQPHLPAVLIFQLEPEGPWAFSLVIPALPTVLLVIHPQLTGISITKLRVYISVLSVMRMQIVVESCGLGINEKADAKDWVAPTTIIDTNQPVVSSVTPGIDETGQRWLFFGTGRLFVSSDQLSTETQSIYGVKEDVFAGFKKVLVCLMSAMHSFATSGDVFNVGSNSIHLITLQKILKRTKAGTGIYLQSKVLPALHLRHASLIPRPWQAASFFPLPTNRGLIYVPVRASADCMVYIT